MGELWRLPDPIENKFLEFRLVDFDAESGSFGNQGVTVLDLDRLLENSIANRGRSPTRSHHMPEVRIEL